MVQKWEGGGVAGSGTPLMQVAPLDSYQQLIDIGI